MLDREPLFHAVRPEDGGGRGGEGPEPHGKQASVTNLTKGLAVIPVGGDTVQVRKAGVGSEKGPDMGENFAAEISLTSENDVDDVVDIEIGGDTRGDGGRKVVFQPFGLAQFIHGLTQR